jgi:hypothetical protein
VRTMLSMKMFNDCWHWHFWDDPWEDMTPLEMTSFISANTEDADPNDLWLILWQKSPRITYWGVKSANFCGDQGSTANEQFTNFHVVYLHIAEMSNGVSQIKNYIVSNTPYFASRKSRNSTFCFQSWI